LNSEEVDSESLEEEHLEDLQVDKEGSNRDKVDSHRDKVVSNRDKWATMVDKPMEIATRATIRTENHSSQEESLSTEEVTMAIRSMNRGSSTREIRECKVEDSSSSQDKADTKETDLAIKATMEREEDTPEIKREKKNLTRESMCTLARTRTRTRSRKRTRDLR